jgi:DNA polymerase-2
MRSARAVRDLDVDVLTGWNTIDFDLTVLQRIAFRLRHALQLGRDSSPMRLRKPRATSAAARLRFRAPRARRHRPAARRFIRMDDYSLDAVAREVLGEGKAVAGDVRDRIGEIVHNYRHDLPAFALYARTDARLAYQIVEKLNVVSWRSRAAS